MGANESSHATAQTFQNRATDARCFGTVQKATLFRMCIMFTNKVIRTFVVVLCRHGEHGVLYVLVLVDLGFVQRFVEVRRVVVFVRDTDTYELGHCEHTHTHDVIRIFNGNGL